MPSVSRCYSKKETYCFLTFAHITFPYIDFSFVPSSQLQEKVSWDYFKNYPSLRILPSDKPDL